MRLFSLFSTMALLQLLLVVVVLTATTGTAWIVPKSVVRSSVRSMTTTTTSGDRHAATVQEMKADIARMRQEALQRLELLNEQMGQAEMAWKNQKEELQLLQQEKDTSFIPTSNSFPLISDPHHKKENDIDSFQEAEQTKTRMQARVERDKMHFMDPVIDITKPAAFDTTTDTITTSKDSAPPLDDTRWRLMLNIGREPGTWMPQTWGASGERVRLHLELEFSPQQLLYEREEFLNGIVGAKVLKVIHGHGDLAPLNMQQGGRQVRIGEVGGWRVAPNEGPMGTSVLRFYFDLEEETRHAKSDVYCPAGRIYCTCGYFPMQDRQKQHGGLEKDLLKKEMRQIEAKYEALATENEMDTDLVSWDKFQRSKKMMDLRMQASKLNTKIHEAQVREPDKSLLRLSQDQSVGLTREGGVCCKVHKGLAIEYHILGKFEIASMTNREHSDYRELLP